MSLWSEKHGASRTKELVVHARKVQELRERMEEGMGKVLVVCGGPGTGKTSTIRCLAKELDLEIVSWSEHSSENSDGNRYSSCRIQQFCDFVSRAIRFSVLGNSRENSTQRPSRIVFVDEASLPNYTYSPKARILFKKALQSLFGQKHRQILVFEATNSFESENTFVQFLDKEFASELEFGKVTFNPVNKSALKKAADLLINKEKVSLPTRTRERLLESCRGDLRTLINSIQFECCDQFCAKLVSNGRRRKKPRASLSTTSVSAEIQYQADEKLSIFHSLGKILHGKQLLDLSALAENTNESVPNVLGFLFENFPSFEHSAEPENLAQIYDSFSLADVLQHGFDEVSFGFLNDISHSQKYAIEIAGGACLHSRLNDPSKSGWQPLFSSFSKTVDILISSRDALLLKGFPSLIHFMGYEFLFKRSLFHCEIAHNLAIVLRNTPSWKQTSEDQRIVQECLDSVKTLPQVSSFRQPLSKTDSVRPKRPSLIKARPIHTFQHSLETFCKIESIFDSDTDSSLSEIDSFSS